MDGNLLKYMAFIRTVEYGSFTKAASLAVKRFLSYVDYRHPATDTMLQ